MKPKFFELAKRVSLESPHHQHKMGAVIVYKNKVISIGFNKIKTHTRSVAPFQMLHAEISALLGLSYENTKGCTVYVYRERRDGTTGMAKPCIGCALALKQAGIKKVYYTTEFGYTEELVA